MLRVQSSLLLVLLSTHLKQECFLNVLFPEISSEKHFSAFSVKFTHFSATSYLSGFIPFSQDVMGAFNSRSGGSKCPFDACEPSKVESDGSCCGATLFLSHMCCAGSHLVRLAAKVLAWKGDVLFDQTMFAVKFPTLQEHLTI